MKDEFNPSQNISDRFDSLEKEVKAWGRITKESLVRRILSLNLREKSRLYEMQLARNKLRDLRYSERPVSTKRQRNILREVEPLHKGLRYTTRRKDGDIESVAFSFARKGIWLEHGVGRGRPVRSAKALAAARPWIAPTLKPALEELGELLEEEYADIVAEQLQILIPGIIDTRIKK